MASSGQVIQPLGIVLRRRFRDFMFGDYGLFGLANVATISVRLKSRGGRVTYHQPHGVAAIGTRRPSIAGAHFNVPSPVAGLATAPRMGNPPSSRDAACSQICAMPR